MPTSTIDSAYALIQSRLTELDAEAKKLESALASLGERPASRHGGSSKKAAADSARAKPRAARKRKSAKRAARGQRRKQLLAAIKASPGARPTELARAIGVKPAQAHNLISKARKDKLVIKKGGGYALKG